MTEKRDHIFRYLSREECLPGLLDSFDRFQKVTHCWRREKEGWAIREVPFIDDWDKEEKKEVIVLFRTLLDRGGAVYGAFHQGSLIAFGALDAFLFGSRGQYLQLVLLHVSRPFRNQGIGKALFLQLTLKAKRLGAQKLYISTQSSRETQAFYRQVGCVDAEEIDAELAQAEPWDVQLEYDLDSLCPAEKSYKSETKTSFFPSDR
ncbi:GNAT family N-acetyltransferase [Candidatus Mcinerneyibacteriota bacterium]|nr:GNAT family N-acetyltransferase [Candidatus Mcinerneyibacteriota bacterium]